MFGMLAQPCKGDLARKAYTAVPYASNALKAVPFFTPEYGRATMQINAPLEFCDTRLKGCCPSRFGSQCDSERDRSVYWVI